MSIEECVSEIQGGIVIVDVSREIEQMMGVGAENEACRPEWGRIERVCRAPEVCQLIQIQIGNKVCRVRLPFVGMGEYDYAGSSLRFAKQVLVCAKGDELRDEQYNYVSHFCAVFDSRNELDSRMARGEQFTGFPETVKVVVLCYGEVGDLVFCGNCQQTADRGARIEAKGRVNVKKESVMVTS